MSKPIAVDQSQLSAAIDVKLAALGARIDVQTARIDALRTDVTALQTTQPPSPSPTPSPAPAPAPTPVPATGDSPAFVLAKATWMANMLAYGKPVATLLADPTVPANVKQDAVYYDGTWVFLQIEQFTNDPAWHVAALDAHAAYRSYLDPNGDKAAGYDIFPHGLELLGDIDTLTLLATNAAFANAPLDWTASADVSRECAYNVQAKVIAKAHGLDVVNLEEQAAQMFDHIRQWTQVLKGQPVTGIPVGQSVPTYCRPFMAALTSYAMIEWAGTDAGRLEQVVNTLAPFWILLDFKCFLPQQPVANNPGLGLVDTLMYTNVVAADGTGGQDPSPDLNLLIAPVYAWLYSQTKLTGWRDQHDALYVGGVQGGYLGTGKQFNQQYQRSFQGLAWRQA